MACFPEFEGKGVCRPASRVVRELVWASPDRMPERKLDDVEVSIVWHGGLSAFLSDMSAILLGQAPGSHSVVPTRQRPVEKLLSGAGKNPGRVVSRAGSAGGALQIDVQFHRRLRIAAASASMESTRINRCTDTKARVLLVCLLMDTAVSSLTLQTTMKRRGVW